MNNGIKFPSGLILAAGFSGRMGTNKALLSFNETSSFIENIARSMLIVGCPHVYIVINSLISEYIKKNNIRVSDKIILLVNDKPELGRFRSIKIGLKEAVNCDIFIHNCDNPFCKPALLNELYNLLDDHSYVVPVFNNRGGHPVLISNFVRQHLVSITEDNANLKNVLLSFNKIIYNTSDNSILVNINTPKDYLLFMKAQKKKFFDNMKY